MMSKKTDLVYYFCGHRFFMFDYHSLTFAFYKSSEHFAWNVIKPHPRGEGALVGTARLCCAT